MSAKPLCRQLLTAAACLVLFSAAAWACPGCAEDIKENQNGFLVGILWSTALLIVTAGSCLTFIAYKIFYKNGKAA